MGPPRRGTLFRTAYRGPRYSSSHGATRSGFTRHLNRRPHSIFESVRVIGRGLFSIAKVHPIVARAHLAEREPEMAGDRFGFLVRHGASMSLPISIRWRIAS